MINHFKPHSPRTPLPRYTGPLGACMLFGLVFAQLPDHGNAPAAQQSSATLSTRSTPHPKMRLSHGPVLPRAELVPLSLAALGIQEEVLKPSFSWRWLDRDLRSSLDRAAPLQGRWQSIVLHSSHRAGISPAALARHQREVRGVAGGPTWHFHISDEAGGVKIEHSERWTYQLDAPHAPQARDNRGTLSIYMAGDFEQTGVSPAQLEALNELIHYLRAKLGHLPVRVLEDEATGRGFPAHEIAQSLNQN